VVPVEFIERKIYLIRRIGFAPPKEHWRQRGRRPRVSSSSPHPCA